MQLSSILYLGTLLTTTSAITVSYDPGYDIGSRSLAVVSCSNGSHGLLTKGYTPQSFASQISSQRRCLDNRGLEFSQLREML